MKRNSINPIELLFLFLLVVAIYLAGISSGNRIDKSEKDFINQSATEWK